MHVSIETCGCKIGHSSPIREPPAGAISPPGHHSMLQI